MCPYPCLKWNAFASFHSAQQPFVYVSIRKSPRKSSGVSSSFSVCDSRRPETLLGSSDRNASVFSGSFFTRIGRDPLILGNLCSATIPVSSFCILIWVSLLVCSVRYAHHSVSSPSSPLEAYVASCLWYCSSLLDFTRILESCWFVVLSLREPSDSRSIIGEPRSYM